MFTVCSALVSAFYTHQLFLTPPYKFCYYSHFTIRKLRSREINQIAPVHIAIRWNSQHLIPSSLVAESALWIIKLYFLPPSNKLLSIQSPLTFVWLILKSLYNTSSKVSDSYNLFLNNSELYTFHMASLKHMHNLYFWKFS